MVIENMGLIISVLMIIFIVVISGIVLITLENEVFTFCKANPNFVGDHSFDTMHDFIFNQPVNCTEINLVNSTLK